MRSNPPRLILHIGRNKTGTSSLQRFLYDQGEELAAAGYCYPRELIRNGFAHHAMAESMARRLADDVPGCLNLARVRARESLSCLNRNATNVLSSEAFVNCDPGLVAEVFEGYEVNVIVYLRNELDYLASAYAQKVHATDYGGTLEQFAATFDMDYGRFLVNWAGYFSLTTRVFSPAKLRQGNVVDDFVRHVLGLPELAAVARVTDQNPSLSRRMVAFKLELNRREQLTREQLRRLYPVLGAMSVVDDSGKYCVSLGLKSHLEQPLLSNQARWSPRFFGEPAVFDYAATRTSDPYQLSNDEYQQLHADLTQRLQSL